MTDAIRDANRVTVALGVSSASATTPLPFKIDSTTGRVLVDSAGSGLSIEDPTGSVNDVNVTFVFTEDPFLLIVNGQTLREDHGYTTNGSGTVTLAAPVGTGGDIYGLIS